MKIVFAFAWRERRVLLTLDRDYLDDRRFPENRNSGVVILSGGGGDDHALGFSLGIALAVVGIAQAIWENGLSLNFLTPRLGGEVG